MKTVTLSVAARGRVTRRALDALSGKRRGAHISFATVDLLWKVLTAKRWALLKTMAGGGASIRPPLPEAGENKRVVAVAMTARRRIVMPCNLHTRQGSC